jgi:heptosyltransferase-3
MRLDKVQKILIIIVSRIGDTLLTTPAIKSIADYYKDADITVLAHPKRYTVLQHLPFVHNVGHISKNTAIWKGRFRKVYDLAFVYGYDESLVLYAIRVSNKVIAFEQRDNKINNKLYRAVKFPTSQGKHFVDLWMTLPHSININTSTRRLSLFTTKKEQLFAHGILIKAGLENKLLIGLQVASFPTKAYRDWPIEYFLELCNKIIKKHPNAHFLIYGGCAEKEKEKSDWLFDNLKGYATSFVGMPLRETAAIMSQTHLYIGVDTGPTHIMSTLNISMVVLFHCQLKSKNYGALDHPHYFAIDHPNTIDCSEESAMSEISVKTVFNVVCKALGDCKL